MRRVRAGNRGVSVASLGMVVLIAVGIGGYLAFGYGLGEAVGMTLLTLTTVGLDTANGLRTDVLLFTAGLAVLGVGLFATILGLAATAIVEGRISLFSRSRRMQRRIDHLNEHFIVCAYGRVGRSVARELEAEGLPFVVIDSKAELQVDMDRDGSATCSARRPMSRCCAWRESTGRGGLICAVDSDAENVYITVVARVPPPRTTDRGPGGARPQRRPALPGGGQPGRLPLRDKWPADGQPGNPPHVVDFFDIARAGQPDLRLEELVIDPGSPLVGRSLQELSGPAVPCYCAATTASWLPTPLSSCASKRATRSWSTVKLAPCAHSTSRRCL